MKSTTKIKMDLIGPFLVPVCGFESGDVDAEVLSLLDGDHLRGWLKPELLHHGLEVVLAWALRGGMEG